MGWLHSKHKISNISVIFLLLLLIEYSFVLTNASKRRAKSSNKILDRNRPSQDVLSLLLEEEQNQFLESSKEENVRIKRETPDFEEDSATITTIPSLNESTEIPVWNASTLSTTSKSTSPLPPYFYHPPPTKFKLPNNYNNLIIPKTRIIGDPKSHRVHAYLMVNILSIREIDEETGTLTVDLDLGIEWNDGFLLGQVGLQEHQDGLTLDSIFLKEIWKPDIYIDELIKVERQFLLNQPVTLTYFPATSKFSYITRLTALLHCEMRFLYYPADSHYCEFTLRSYTFLNKDLRLHWAPNLVRLQDDYDPNFYLKLDSVVKESIPHLIQEGEYDALKFTILARRSISYHLVQTYLPSIFFIVITWLCFLLPVKMAEARIGISMTTLLTLTSMFSAVRENTPIVSYVKAIDIWMVSCIFFVFLTLLEFVILVWLRSRREDAEDDRLQIIKRIRESEDKPKSLDGHNMIGETTFRFRSTFSSVESVKLRKYEEFAELIEKYAFPIFATAFLLYNVGYWSWLFISSDYFNWEVKPIPIPFNN